MQNKRLAGLTLPAVSAVVMLAACSNPTSSASSNLSADATPAATAATTQSVSNVSDAVGLRLDTMLNSRPTAGVSR